MPVATSWQCVHTVQYSHALSHRAYLLCEVSTADGDHVSRYSEVECPVTGLSVGVHTGKPQAEAQWAWHGVERVWHHLE